MSNPKTNHELKLLIILNFCASTKFADVAKNVVKITFPIISRSNQFSLQIEYNFICSRTSEFKGRSIMIYFATRNQSYERTNPNMLRELCFIIFRNSLNEKRKEYCI